MSEADRIRDAYRKREADGKSALYSPYVNSALLGMHTAERGLIAALRRRGIDTLEGKRILDVGCGNGRNLQRLVDLGADTALLSGVDLREDVIERGKILNPGMDLRTGNAENLPFDDDSFDLVMQYTVFTSILDDAMKFRVAAEMLRVLRPGGLIIWFDFHYSNPRNSDVRGIGRSEIKKLFPECDISLRRVVLAPPLARRIAPISYTLAHVLSAFPWLCTHDMGTIKPGHNQVEAA